MSAFQVERRPLPETETERSRARHAAAEAARARVPAPRRRFGLAGIAPRGFVSSNLNGGGRKCQSASAEKLRLNHEPDAVMTIKEVVAAALPKPKEIARTPELKGARAAPWHERMVGWLGELVDPAPLIFADIEKGTALKPLKVGMHKELTLRPGISAKRLSTWFANWCNSLAYVEAVAAPGSMRHDLEGRPVDPVSDSDRAKAAERLPELRREAAERIAAAKRQPKAPPPVAEPEQVEETISWCRDCLNPGDLYDGLCGDCRAPIVVDHHDENHHHPIPDHHDAENHHHPIPDHHDAENHHHPIMADGPLIGAEAGPAERKAAAEWYRETLNAARARRLETARRCAAASRKQRRS